MKLIPTKINDLVLLEPNVYEDERGYFFESYNEAVLKNLGINAHFIQDNQSFSKYGTIRGLHAQTGEYAQAKLVRVLQGTVLDVAVDIRKDSPTYGQHVSTILSDENKRLFYIPRGFLHGFSVLSETAVFFYKCDNFYNRAAELCILYNDPSLCIDWMIEEDKKIISAKDLEGVSFSSILL